ncbi:MAG: hypothetical protein A2Y07_04045 [Planctomycetes bacterium GWF2_50_10]|nr:MAG: hypothetical protein A2Y07_04045 [Planctomycetes bacterium GWF2_50_10]
MKYQRKSIKGISVSLKVALLAIAALLMPTVAEAATYYVDAVSGSDSGNGSSTSPWKTIGKAKATVAAGDTVLLQSGNYGGVSFGNTDRNGLSWTSPITYKAASGSNPVFDYLNVAWGSSTTPAKRYLVFDGISVIAKSGTGRVVSIADSSFLQFKNMLIQGDFRTRGVAGTTGYCVYFSTPNSKSINDVWIDNCEIRDASVGIELTGTIGNNVVIRNNELHHFAASGIKPATKIGNGTIYIEGNEIYDQDVVDDAHGTGISIRNDNMVIRGNVIHNYGNTRGIRSYGLIFPTTGYCNMLIENNLVYDTINMYSVEFCDVGSNFVIRNNTFVGRPRGRTGCSYYEYALQIQLATGVNGSGLKMNNNVFVGAVSVSSSVPSANINNNIIYSLIRSGSWISALTNNKIVTSSATNSSYFYPSGKFFLGGSEFDNYAFKVVTRTTGADLIDEYQLASGSPGVDICPLTTASASDMLEASRVDIASVGNNGSNYADAGCYEFGGKPSSEPVDSNFTFVDVGPQSVVEDHALTFKLSATDPAGAAVTYTAANMPSGATLSGDTFTWTPTYSQSGSYTVTFKASNGTATLSQAVTITVTNANRAPVMSAIATQNATSGSMLSFNVVASDPDGDALSYSATGLPSGASFTGSTFSWIPTVTQAGSYDVLFTVSDGQLQVSRTVTIVVDGGVVVPVNKAPVLAAIGSKTVQVGNTLSFNLAGTDAENDTLTYSASTLPSGATLSGQTFSWTPTTAGTYSVTFRVSDGQLADSETVAITVTAVSTSTNKPPVFAVIGNKTVKERDALQFYVNATDPEGKAVTYSIKGLPTYASFTGNKFYWRPTFIQQGTHTVTFTASDGVTTSSSTITITVVNVNQPPRLYDIGSKSVNEASKLTIYAKGADPDKTPVTFSAKGLPAGATFTPGSYGTFTWTPTRLQAGTYYVTFTISDGLLTDSETVTITVRNV